ncbi:hypothetical protein BDW62DRAFT_220638 [Aspergillus aurantiobrunneus]
MRSPFSEFMAESVPMGDTSGCPPTFSLVPPFIPTVIKQRLTSLRYTIIRVQDNQPPQAMFFSSGDSPPRPSSSGSASTARQFDDCFGCVPGSNDEYTGTGSNGDVLAVGAPANHEVNSGLRWNRVNPALNLLRHAGYEAQQPQCESRLVRSLYLHSMAYLLSALPADLTSDEAATLQDSLPEKLKPSVTSDRSSHPGPATYPVQRSYVHRLLSASIIYFCLLLQYIMPYIKDVMFHLYQYGRAHRVTERATSLLLYVAEKVGRGGLNLGSTVLDMYEGKPSCAVSEAASWWLEGVAGGIYEGVGEGMVILGFSGLSKDSQ